MKKIIFIFVLFFLSLIFVSAYEDPGEIIGYEQNYSIRTYSSDDVRFYLDNQPFTQTLKNLYDDIIESNFTINYLFDVQPKYYDFSLKIYLGNSKLIENIFSSTDVFGVASLRGRTGILGIDVENIYTYYNKSKEDLFYRIENTFLHELAHIYTYNENNKRKLSKNLNKIFNISYKLKGQRLEGFGFDNYELTNKDYFINISSEIVGEVPASLENSIYFPSVYNVYDPKDYIDETIVRILAICYTQEQDLDSLKDENYRILVPTNYTYCQRFPNLYSSFVSRDFADLYADVVLGISSSLKNIPKKEIIVENENQFIQKFKSNVEIFGLKFLATIFFIVLVQTILIGYLLFRFYKRIKKLINN